MEWNGFVSVNTSKIRMVILKHKRRALSEEMNLVYMLEKTGLGIMKNNGKLNE